MTRLRSRDKFPPMGWTFYQAETGWHAPAPMSTSFIRTRDQIISHRRLNPAFPLTTDPDAVEWELENFTVLRLGPSSNYVYGADPLPQSAPLPNVVKKRGCGAC